MLKKKNIIITIIITLCIVTFIFRDFAISAVSTISGIALQQSNTIWNNLKDAASGDNQTNGIGANGLYLFDGTNFDRARGDSTYGLDVDITRFPATGGSAFYAIKKANLDPNSYTFSFGFLSKKVSIETPYTNTDDVIIDWLGDPAVAPVANTAGDDLLSPGHILIFDEYEVSSISAASVSGTQTIYVRAYQ
jgi:hypothetical protein